jgi:CheY-like chemotaxis protein
MPRETAPPPHKTVDNAPAPPVSVLILDDERFDRHRLARLCSGLGFDTNVSNARDLSGFADLLDRARFDLILVDYYLPDGTGLEALEQVRLSPRNLNSAVIMITGLGQDSLAQQAMQGGCAGYLTKDELTAGGFQQAVAEALRQPLPLPQAGQASYDQPMLEGLLAQQAAQGARDIKPMVSRLMRQLRDLRALTLGAADDRQTLTRLDHLEDSCLSLWEFLIQSERCSGADLAARLMPPTAEAPKDPAPSPRRKPPSPFSRRIH